MDVARLLFTWLLCSSVLWEVPAQGPHPSPPGASIVDCERPRDALIVEVTGMRAEYAKPPVNPIKWSELPVVWGELAICFQDLSRRRSALLPSAHH